MSADSLQALARDYFRDRAGSLGLDRNTLVVEYVLNWGGFVNHSFRVHDARRAYHLKLSTAPDDRDALRRWQSLGAWLEPYHAPPILDWVDLGPAAGLLFPFVPGRPPAVDAEIVAELLPVLVRLGADRELAAGLEGPIPITAADAYRASFHQRFTDDLSGIRATPPPFIDTGLLRWLDEQVGQLTDLITANPAFAEPLVSPVHGDLWPNNILWVDRGHWYLIDWDDLRIGDPVADLAALLGPDARDLRPLKLADQVSPLLSATERERLPLLGRATLLDWVIDPVADWIDAGTAPEHGQEVRAEKERVHRRALEAYRDLAQ